MSVKLGVIMDPIEQVRPWKDTTFAMLLAAQHRGWSIQVMEQHQLYLRNGQAHAQTRQVRVHDKRQDFFEQIGHDDGPLSHFDILLMRKDPPFDMDYIYTTHLLERAEAAGVLVGNQPAALRDVNEKLYTAWFPEHCPETLVTASQERLREFINEQQDVIIKPLDGMGGQSIYRLTTSDPNIPVILEAMTAGDRRLIMAQRYLPEIRDGDKRVLVVDGKPEPWALARIPSAGETRGNLAAGGRGVPIPLGDTERAICESIAPTLIDKGLLFVGVDIIGNRMTEINVTSPTCAREIDAHVHALAGSDGPGYRTGIADRYLDALQRRLPQAG